MLIKPSVISEVYNTTMVHCKLQLTDSVFFFAVIRMVVGFLILCVGWYTIQIYIDLFGRWTTSSLVKEPTVKKESGKIFPLLAKNIAISLKCCCTY